MRNFLKCGMVGWCLEVFWTGLGALFSGEKKLTGQSSLWMFPIYGMASFIGPLYRMLKGKPFLVRGYVYGWLILGVEYLSGCLLKKKDLCPWDYSKARFNIKGVIRVDYFPLWVLAGLLFEKVNVKS